MTRLRFRRHAVACLCLGLAACAPLPGDLPPRPELAAPRIESLTAGSTTTTASLDAPWWLAYRDDALNGLIERALSGNPSLVAARARIEAAQRMERLAEIDAGLNAEATVSVSRNGLTANGIFPPPIGGSRYTEEDANIGASYSFDWWGRNHALIAAATSDKAAAQAEQESVRLAVSALVADAYFVDADATARGRMACESAAKRRELARLLHVRLAQGLDPADRVLRAESALAQDEDQCLALDYQARAARYRLAALMGEGPDDAAALPPAHLDTAPALPASLPLDWLGRRPDVAAQRARTEAEAARSDATRADFYPNIDVTLLAGLQTVKIEKWLERDSFNGSFGPALHIPLFDTRRLQTRLGLAESSYAAAVSDYNRTVVDAARQTADNHALAASLDRRIVAQAEALAAAERTDALAETRRARGLADQLEPLNNRIAVLVLRQADAQLRAARLRADVALAQSLGGSTHAPTGNTP